MASEKPTERASSAHPARTATRPRNATSFHRLSVWLAEHLSIRRRLTLWYGLLLITLLTLVSSVTFAVAQNQIQSNLNNDIRQRAIAVANALQHEQYTSTGGSNVLPTVTAGASGATPVPQATATPATTATPAKNAKATATPAISPTPVTTPDPATNAAIQKQLLTVPDVLGRLDLGFEVLNTAGRLKYLAPSLNGKSLPINYAVVNGALRGVAGSYSASANGVLLAVYAQPIVIASPTTGQTPGVGATPTSRPSVSAHTGQVVGVVLVAKSQQDVNGALGTLGRTLFVADIVAIVIALLIGWLIAETSLRPIATITRTASAIARDASAAGLGTRVTYRGAKDEVGELASTFNEMLASLEQVAEAQRRFVSDASHELRAPLTIIRGNLEMLRQTPDHSDADRAEIVDDAYVEAERMSTLVSDLLLLARVDAASASRGARATQLDERLSGRREAVEMDQFVMDLFHSGQSHLRALRKQIRLSVIDIAPVTVMADPGQIRQLGMILLDNAIKYTPANGQIRLSLEQIGSRAVFTISDTGIGISAEDLPHIYERFWRADRARERDEHGSGLGLAIALWIAQAHHGEIKVESAPGKGSVFTVSLPAVMVVSDQSGPKVATGRRKRVRRNTLSLDAIKPLARLAQSVSRPRPGLRVRSGGGESDAPKPTRTQSSPKRGDDPAASGSSPAPRPARRRS